MTNSRKRFDLRPTVRHMTGIGGPGWRPCKKVSQVLFTISSQVAGAFGSLTERQYSTILAEHSGPKLARGTTAPMRETSRTPARNTPPALGLSEGFFPRAPPFRVHRRAAGRRIGGSSPRQTCAPPRSPLETGAGGAQIASYSFRKLSRTTSAPAAYRRVMGALPGIGGRVAAERARWNRRRRRGTHRGQIARGYLASSIPCAMASPLSKLKRWTFSGATRNAIVSSVFSLTGVYETMTI